MTRGERAGVPVGRPGASVASELVLARRHLLAGAALCALSGGGLALVEDGRVELALGGPTETAQARRAADPGCVNHVRTRRPWVALTFDDGPDPAYTPHVLDVLRRHEARATFFVVGRNAGAHPDLVARIRAEGHLVANHTQDHAHLTELPAGEVLEQLTRCRAVIGDVGAAGRLVRPPVGRTSTTVARVARRAGERQVFWSECLEACLHDGATQGGRRLGESLAPGAVLLAHDGGHVTGRWGQTYDRTPTLEALPRLLEGLSARGLRSVTVPELVAAGRPR